MRVPTDAAATMTVSGPLTHLCPYADETDDGRVTITWRCAGATFELHALAEYLRGFKTARVSHEELTDRIRRDLSGGGVEILWVETTWETAGMTVRTTI